ncbi:hypothetical protein SNE40_009022 [Patella caerulea]|uniref:Uncharacterized protein n=1 Tax=Patella caerulea TaxID=87958 RepID=A0AAN8JRH6_PATCE
MLELWPLKPPLLTQIGFWISLISSIVHTFGCVTNAWFINNEIRFKGGIWTYCFGDICGYYPNKSMKAEFKATRILECLGIMFGTGSTVLLFLYTCLQQSTVVEAVAAFHALVASILIPIGVKLYIDDKSPNGELGYSVAVTSVGGKLYMITFLCLLCDMYWKSSWRKTNSFCTRISKWTQIFIKRISHR